MAQVDCSATVLEAITIMNKNGSSGIVAYQGNKPIGMLTDRALLTRFLPLNKRPDEVKVGDVIAPLIKIDAGASTKEAAKKIVENAYTRLGVFDADKFLGWVTLTDLAREVSKENLLDALRMHVEPRKGGDVLCPNCRKAFLTKIVNTEGNVSGWQCTNCNYTL